MLDLRLLRFSSFSPFSGSGVVVLDLRLLRFSSLPSSFLSIDDECRDEEEDLEGEPSSFGLLDVFLPVSACL